MRLALLIISLLISVHLSAHEFNVFRKNLENAPKDKTLCFDMISKLEKNQQNNTAVAYLGAYTMIKANHQINPIQKLASFKAGKKLLERAITKAPNDLELRYIRYAIQISIPSFLGYKDNLVEDKKFLHNKSKESNSSLKADIIKILAI